MLNYACAKRRTCMIAKLDLSRHQQIKERKKMLSVVPFRKQHKVKNISEYQHRSVLRAYKSYNFVDKDPVIHKLEQAVKDSGMSYTAIEEASGVTTKTLYAWFYGKTRRPQYATLNAVARAIGFSLDLVKRKGI
jgi:DNA-binding phage protein